MQNATRCTGGFYAGAMLHALTPSLFIRTSLLDHQCDLEDNGMVEFPQVQTSQLLDLFQTVHQCVPVYKQLSGSFRNIQVVLEELLNGKQRFMIQRFNAA